MAGATRDFDAVIIGSGMGGLTAAALLGRLTGRRVLVLERHWRAGGFTHTFKRPGGYRWDVGVHYVGADVVRPGLLRDVFRVTTGGAVTWTRMPEPFERLVFPGFEYSIHGGGANRFADDLADAFPSETAGIRDYVSDVRRAQSGSAAIAMRGVAPAPAVALTRLLVWRRLRLARRTAADVIAKHVRRPVLRAVLGARWLDHGLPPSSAAFFPHAVITAHYFDGGYYPEGSAARIAEEARRIIETSGGVVRVRAGVERILVERGRALGVRLAGGEEIRAPIVISDAGARATFLSLLADDVPVPFRDLLRRVPPGLAHVSLYLGLSSSPAELGVRGENFWIHCTLDQDAIWERRGGIVHGEVPAVYVSFPSMKDPLAQAHTAEVIAPANMADFAPWARSRWKRRGPEYEALKERISDAMLDIVERRIPGFRRLVAYRELSTPLSTEAITGHAEGEIYGIPWTPERFDLPFLQSRTPVAGLFLTGSDALFPGVAGTTMSGLMTAAAVAGPGVFARVRREATALDSAPMHPASPAANQPETNSP